MMGVNRKLTQRNVEPIIQNEKTFSFAACNSLSIVLARIGLLIVKFTLNGRGRRKFPPPVAGLGS